MIGTSAEAGSRAVRLAATGALVLLLAGAGWLIAVRGEAMLVDLAGFAGKVWCF